MLGADEIPAFVNTACALPESLKSIEGLWHNKRSCQSLVTKISAVVVSTVDPQRIRTALRTLDGTTSPGAAERLSIFIHFWPHE